MGFLEKQGCAPGRVHDGDEPGRARAVHQQHLVGFRLYGLDLVSRNPREAGVRTTARA